MILKSIITWIDNSAKTQNKTNADEQIELIRILPFILIHLACLGVIWVEISTTAVIVALVLYAIRMFAITGFYHRYFAHKAFKTSRFTQFIFAFLGATAAQRGPLWWASHHRHHHAYSDKAQDTHSPVQHGFLWSHLGWFLANKNFSTDTERVKELTQYPELRFLDRFDAFAPLLLGLSLYILGIWLDQQYPALNTSGEQLLVWGFAISTVAVYHMTFTVNSLAHVWGKRRYATPDDSRNNFWIALFTLGEGWHNNHHHYPGAARQGFYWWEIDLTYYGLKLLAAFGLIWQLRMVPTDIRNSRRVRT
ncbi:MAG TPA: acyl-CoA desaturase [Methylophilaceae bacterium]|jgi:stearoyl-CoA desaturase (delta-9 desaturase)